MNLTKHKNDMPGEFHFNMEDEPRSKKWLEHLADILVCLAGTLAGGGNAYVHCVQGVHRTGTPRDWNVHPQNRFFLRLLLRFVW
jgi:protein-tyrosine phosphatase